MAAYGPKALKLCGEQADGFILQLADPQIATWTIEAVRTAASDAGRDPDAVKICVAAPAYVGDDLAHQRDQVRWFGGMVGNHVADLVDALRSRHRPRSPRPSSATSRTARATTTPNTARPTRPTSTSSPTRSSTASACWARRRPTSSGSRSSGTLGVDQFAVYLQHDGQDETLTAYGEKVLPRPLS